MINTFAGQRRFIRSACAPIMAALESRIMLADHFPATATQLQTAIDTAALGDNIILDAGTTYSGNFTLKNKTAGSGWITIRTSNLAGLPAAGVRATPSHAGAMARLQTPNGSSV